MLELRLSVFILGVSSVWQAWRRFRGCVSLLFLFLVWRSFWCFGASDVAACVEKPFFGDVFGGGVFCERGDGSCDLGQGNIVHSQQLQISVVHHRSLVLLGC